MSSCLSRSWWDFLSRFFFSVVRFGSSVAFIEIPTTIRTLWGWERGRGRLPWRVNFTRHYPDVDFFVLSGRGTTWKPLGDLFSMDDGPGVRRRESLVERVQRRAMQRDVSRREWLMRSSCIPCIIRELSSNLAEKKWQPWNINLFADNNFSKIN